MIRVLLAILIMLSPMTAYSAEMSASQLNEHCQEIKKGITGQTFKQESVQLCRGYISGFFDSMVILESLTKKYYFCIPKLLPTDQSDILLESWIKENSKIAGKTTASVALFSAFKKAFPCDSANR